MATFRNDTGDDLTIDRFGLYIPAGATFEIPDVDADSLAGPVGIVRVASDVPAEVPLPVEVVRDLVEIAGYSPVDLDETAESDPADAGEPADDATDPAADVPSATSDVPSATEDVHSEPVEADTAPTTEPADTEPAPVDEEPAGDLDSFTQS